MSSAGPLELAPGAECACVHNRTCVIFVNSYETVLITVLGAWHSCAQTFVVSMLEIVPTVAIAVRSVTLDNKREVM